jgi:hypothetical protein
MPTALPHAGDVGTVIRRTIKDENGAVVALGTAAVLKLIFLSPDSTVTITTAVMVGDGSTGQLQHTTIVGDPVYNIPGVWAIQAYVEFPGGKWHSTTGTRTVEENLN